MINFILTYWTPLNPECSRPVMTQQLYLDALTLDFIWYTCCHSIQLMAAGGGLFSQHSERCSAVVFPQRSVFTFAQHTLFPPESRLALSLSRTGAHARVGTCTVSLPRGPSGVAGSARVCPALPPFSVLTLSFPLSCAVRARDIRGECLREPAHAQGLNLHVPCTMAHTLFSHFHQGLKA